PLLNSCSLFTLIPRPSTSPLFPYTTLFRSYAPLGILLDATEIGMAGTSGSYVNTMVIQDKTGDPEIDAGRWKTAMEMTTGIYNLDRKSTRLNSSHVSISYAVFCLKKKK